MIQFKDYEVCQMAKAATYYRDRVTGSDDIWDRYNSIITKLYAYGEEASTTNLNCESPN